MTTDPAAFNEAARQTWRRNRLLSPRPGVTPAAALPPSFSLVQDQTAIRDQDGRDHCWGFAALAALEAAYRRQFQLTLDLSEQYFIQICRAAGLGSGPIENAHSLWGAGGNSGSIGSLIAWWVPTEDLAPYLSESQLEAVASDLGVLQIKDWPPDPTTTQDMVDRFEWDERIVPRRARWDCRYGVTGIAAQPDLTVEAIKATLVSGHEVVIDINLWVQTDATGRWVFDPSGNQGAHVVVVVGYDDHDQDGTFVVKNSWGGTSMTRIAYSFLERPETYLGGHHITGIVAPDAPAQRQAFWLGRWSQDHDGWRGTTVMRRFTDAAHPTKLGTYRRDDGSEHDVNGWWEQGGLHTRFWIADQTGPVPWGSQTGQPFNAWVFNWDPPSAAGTTIWSSTPYGVQLSRDPIAATPSGAFSRDLWLGTWHMDHDGWRGTLVVTGFGSPDLFGQHLDVHASYTPDGGAPLPTSAFLWVAAQHHLSLSITFPGASPQPFEVFHHTWETDLFSGVTQWNGSTFGVKAHRDTPKGKEKEKDKEGKDHKEAKEKDLAKDRKDGMIEKSADRLPQAIFGSAHPSASVPPETDLTRGQRSFISSIERPDLDD